jgi:hypothetical protein
MRGSTQQSNHGLLCKGYSSHRICAPDCAHTNTLAFINAVFLGVRLIRTSAP